LIKMENGVQRAGQRSKESLKSKLEGNQLDLSLSSLDVVPVRELAALPRATCVDLSCNRLVTLGSEFGTLTHLVRLDLSKNQLISLPDDFGCLQKLQHLDLYNNKLTRLPLTFCKLNSLKWMDLRDNPLDAGLSEHAGDCLNETQCRNCAKQVVAYMKKCQSEDERQRQKRLQEERMRESARKLEEELERQRTQLAKKAMKEQKRKELASQKRQVRQNDDDDDGLQDDGSGSTDADVNVKGKSEMKRQKKSKKDGGMSFCGLLFSMLFFFLTSLCFIVVGLYIYCSSSEVNAKTPVCNEGRLYSEATQRLANETWVATQRLANEAWVSMKDLIDDVQRRITARLS